MVSTFRGSTVYMYCKVYHAVAASVISSQVITIHNQNKPL